MGGTETTRRGFIRGLAGGVAVASTAGTGSGQEQRVIEMTDSLVFDPDAVTVAPGTTVVWENTGSVGHSVTAYEDEIPGNAAYFASGGFDSEQAARDAYPEGEIGGGESFERTLDVEGVYEYFCIPHESAGMVGSIEVSAGSGGGGGSGGVLPSIPGAAKTLAVATVSALFAVLAVTYFFLKYGGDYGLD
ncbi:plastocyanin/azurin family copper-binding protein [Haladaptatus caseinilyticus]|uniref:plastocyanin/azurin family copper-binding protein n=1 Tax=Haladaptatus caseinilyticus TaxID=2993314 RepID=UPI00224AB08E|nr:plastocyanin/azurin family copper-binding protein [Haladaptatus caseinilyticus]